MGFSAVLVNRGTPAPDWSVNSYPFQTAASDRGRVVDDIKTNNKYLIVNSEDFNYHSSQLESTLNNQNDSIPALKRDVRTLDKQTVAVQETADAHWGKDASGRQMTREDVFKKVRQRRDDFNEQNDNEVLAIKYSKEVYQPAIAACHRQNEGYCEVLIRQKRDFGINKQRRQTFLQSRKLGHKLRDSQIMLGKEQYPLTMGVSEIDSRKVATLIKIDDINRTNEHWRKGTKWLRRNRTIK